MGDTGHSSHDAMHAHPEPARHGEAAEQVVDAHDHHHAVVGSAHDGHAGHDRRSRIEPPSLSRSSHWNPVS
jgi:hypothetical protein